MEIGTEETGNGKISRSKHPDLTLNSDLNRVLCCLMVFMSEPCWAITYKTYGTIANTIAQIIQQLYSDCAVHA